jgi:hypothetical protein
MSRNSPHRRAAAMLSGPALPSGSAPTAGGRMLFHRVRGRRHLRSGPKAAGQNYRQRRRLVERFQSSNHMGCPKRPHSVDGKPKLQLSGFMESVV